MSNRSDYCIKDLGTLAGPVLLFGGPYSNLQASQALLEIAGSQQIPVSNRICTGDLVAYCGDPSATLNLWRGACVLVAGNCEKQLGAGALDCGCGFDQGSACDLLSKGWYPLADAAMSPSDRAYLRRAPDIVTFRTDGQRCAVLHGGVRDVARFIWSQSERAVFEEEIAALLGLVGPLDVVVAGHAGIGFQRRIGDVNWINAGVIGMPANDGLRDTQYVIMDNNGFEFKRLSYDSAAASKAMQSAGLTQGYAQALQTGYWPSQDVLPRQMRVGDPVR